MFEVELSRIDTFRNLVKALSVIVDEGTFNIGKRNYLILRKIFWKNGVMIHGEHVGASLSRTMRLDLSSGRVTVKTKDGEVEI